MKNILAVIGGITVVVVIVGSILGIGAFLLLRRAAPVVPGAPATQRAPPAAPVAPIQPVPAVDGVRLLVTKVYDPCETGTLYKPASNERSVGVEVALFNDSSPDVIDSSAAYFSLMGSDGLPYEARYFWCDRTIESSRLSTGQSIRGVLGFQMPVGVTPKAIRLNRMGADSFVEAAIP